MVNKELVIHVSDNTIHIALLEDKLLMEYHKVEREGGFCVGDIYLGKVRKTMAGLNASFVNIGHAKDAFLHRLDLGVPFKSMDKLISALSKKKKCSPFTQIKQSEPHPTSAKITEILSAGDVVLTQVSKEAISTKGPRLTCEISITGRHVVLLPFGNKISFSQKIKSNEERKRLKRHVIEVLPHNFGVIVRTAAKGVDGSDVENDIISLISKWDDILERVKNSAAPSLILSEDNRINTMLRDILNDQFSNVFVDDKSIFEEIKKYINNISPDQEKIVKLYKGSVSIFDNFDITRQIKGQFGKLIPFKRKAYMIIEHTEALHVIDINSGTRINNTSSQEEASLEVNLNAIDHIARQLRLRDMGGIIVIDFIDMHKKENRETLLKAMKEAMNSDRAKHTILPLTRFGLMQITRQRVRPETKINILETCPSCNGTGEITPSILFDTQIEARIKCITEEQECKNLIIKVHPYLAAYINKGLFSQAVKWMFKFKCYLKVVPDEAVGYVDARYYDKYGVEFSSGDLLDRYDDGDCEEEREDSDSVNQ